MSNVFAAQYRIEPRCQVNGNNGDITSLDYNGKQLQDRSKFTHLSSGLGEKLSKSLLEGQLTQYRRNRDGILEHCQRKYRCYHHQNQHNCRSIASFRLNSPSFTRPCRRTTILSAQGQTLCTSERTPLQSLASESCASLLACPSQLFLMAVLRLRYSHPRRPLRGLMSLSRMDRRGPSSTRAYRSYATRFTASPDLASGRLSLFLASATRHRVAGLSSEVCMADSLGQLGQDSDHSIGCVDINNQGGDQQEVYWYMNSGHYQPDLPYRLGFFGPWVPATD